MMALPNFTLEPWELPFCGSGTLPTEPATARLEVLHRGRQQAFLLRTSESWPNRLVFFRRDQENTPNQAVSSGPLRRALLEGIPTAHLHFKEILEDKIWFRAFALDCQLNWATLESADVSLVLSGSGLQAWTPFPTATRCAGYFGPLFSEYELEHLNAHDIYARIMEQLSDPASDCSFALRWIKADRSERVRPLLRFNRGSLEELEDVLKWWVWHFYGKQQYQNAKWRIRIENADDETVSDKMHADSVTNYEVELDEHFMNPSAIALKFYEVVQKFFDPRYDANTAIKHKAVAHVLQTSKIFWEFNVAPPSNHERLETRLHLHNWLQGKVPPEEIPVLLGGTT